MTADPPKAGRVSPIAPLPLDQAIARIERAIADIGEGRAVLATDGDGTLWTNDIGDALLAAAIEDRRVGTPALSALLAEADAYQVAIADRTDGAAIVRALDDAHRAQRYPEDRMYEVTAWCLAGMRRTDVDAFCADVLDRRFGLRAHFIEESMALLKWAAKRLPLWLVSASPRPIVERAAAMVGEVIGVVPSVIAMSPRFVEDAMIAELEGISIYGEGKRRALEAALSGHELACAMGDNRFDAAMLRASRVPLAIRPKPALEAVAAEVPGLSRLVL